MKYREAWVPLGSRWARGPRSDRNLQVKARLQPGVSLEEAQAELSTLLREGRYACGEQDGGEKQCLYLC